MRYKGEIVKIRLSDKLYAARIKGILESDPTQYVAQLLESGLHYFINESTIVSDEGAKETEGKISYQEIDWNFIKAMAERMSRNKDKYGPNNWKKPMDLNLIKDATLRHLLAVISPSSDDPESVQDHLAAIGCNAQILYYHECSREK